MLSLVYYKAHRILDLTRGLVIRFLDIVIAGTGLLCLSPLLVVLFLVGALDTGSPIFAQTRMGKSKNHFTLFKFRTMKLDTDSVGTHLVDAASVTRLGVFLRRSKLDELPQLWNVLIGEMSLVGPRPNLPNQFDLIELREGLGVFNHRPGITGLAQIRGIDMSTPGLLAATDRDMLDKLSLFTYAKIIALTIIGQGQGDRIGR